MNLQVWDVEMGEQTTLRCYRRLLRHSSANPAPLLSLIGGAQSRGGRNSGTVEGNGNGKGKGKGKGKRDGQAAGQPQRSGPLSSGCVGVGSQWSEPFGSVLSWRCGGVPAGLDCSHHPPTVAFACPLPHPPRPSHTQTPAAESSSHGRLQPSPRCRLAPHSSISSCCLILIPWFPLVLPPTWTT